MAKKKAKKAVRKKASKKKFAKKAASKKKSAKKAPKKKATRTKAAAKKKTAKKAAKKKATRKKTVRPMPLGRPKVTLDSKLDELFLKDYEVRQVFEFLNVSTLRELEDHNPDEIVERLTAPMVQAVGRIRKVLALQKRCLKGDQKFAKEFTKLMEQELTRRR
jgi:hypothetical protein